MRLSLRWLAAAATGLAAAAAAISLSVVAGPASAAQPETATAADEQATLVEDFSYPGAAQIKDQYGITLTSGDGHIIFADCRTSQGLGKGLLQVYTTESIGADGEGMLCFQITGTTGYLNLLVPAVYEIHGDGVSTGQGHKVTAELTTDAGTHSSVEVNPSGSTPVGVGAKPGNPPTTLLRLQAHT
ncbi:hypothetical protein [Amycolatopsis dongchuanensis]|uniref:Uncharacterized protein n=1 Tax=Amycolatopsis dongchuanensis TaxID=1070866 RepID=A0ABP9PX17_9PSEU